MNYTNLNQRDRLIFAAGAALAHAHLSIAHARIALAKDDRAWLVKSARRNMHAYLRHVRKLHSDGCAYQQVAA